MIMYSVPCIYNTQSIININFWIPWKVLEMRKKSLCIWEMDMFKVTGREKRKIWKVSR